MRLQVCIPLDAATPSAVPVSRFSPVVTDPSLVLPLPALQLSATVPMRGIVDMSGLPVQLLMSPSRPAGSVSSWRAFGLSVYVEGMLEKGLSRVSIASSVTGQGISASIALRAFGDWDAAAGSINLQGSLDGMQFLCFSVVPVACARRVFVLTVVLTCEFVCAILEFCDLVPSSLGVF
jgi:hypothetical protein